MIYGKILLAGFGNNYVKLALARYDLREANIYACEKIEAPVYAGEIVNTSLMADIFKDYLKRNKIGKCKVKIIVQHPLSMIRLLVYPALKTADLDKTVKNSLVQLFPKNEKDFIYDYRTKASADGTVLAVMVRIPEDTAKAYAGFFEELGLKPVLLDTYSNAVSVYLENNENGNFAAVFENPIGINILCFIDGRLAATRDIRYADKEYAVSELRSYLHFYMRGIKKIYLFTDLKIADEAMIGLELEIKRMSGQFTEFYGLP